MNIATYTKEPTSVTEYEIDWSVWLNGRTIVTSTWTVEAGITEDSESNTTTVASIVLSGGTWGESYIATNHIVASDSEEEENSITIKIQQEQKYASLTEVRRRRFGGSGSGGSATTTALPDNELEALIEQASRFLDLAVGVEPGYFNPPAYPDATPQTFYGQGISYLRLPPYVAGSLSTTLTAPTGYTLPTFIERDGYLIITDTNGLTPHGQWRYPYYTTGWWEGVPITVSAIWGFEQVPPDVKLATIELVINLVRETDPATLKLTDLAGMPLREKLPPRVAEIARRYRPKVGAAFA